MKYKHEKFEMMELLMHLNYNHIHMVMHSDVEPKKSFYLYIYIEFKTEM
jgi:hypothetical protein